MRFIIKGAEPESFTSWKALRNDDWQPSYQELSNPEKSDIYNTLLKEQGFLCCYCERELKNGDYHLEHLNPQAAAAGDDLDFNNFLCSCLKPTTKGEPLHCGNSKGNRIIPIHPLQKNCQQQFTFTADGKISGINDDANQTISILALNLSKLNDLRAQALEPFLDPSLSEQDLQQFLRKYLENTAKLNPFLSAVEYVFRDYI